MSSHFNGSADRQSVGDDPPWTEADTLVTLAGREISDLSGSWSLTLDLFGEGFSQNWPALDTRPLAAWELPRDYDITGGRRVAVPSCWNVNLPEWSYFEGVGWYTRTFTWRPSRPGDRTVLAVGGAALEATIFLNGRKLGRHRGGSTPFSVELTGHLVAGENRIHVAVDNRRRPDRIPPLRFDWFNYGGLYREIGLVRLPPVFIRQFRLGLVRDRSLFSLLAEIELSDPAEGFATVKIPELNVEADVWIADGTGSAVLSANPVLWSPVRPKLYEVTVSFRDDTVSDRIGFREIRADGRQLFLNGQPLVLRGICVHEDDALLGKTSTEADVRRTFAYARELNCNFLRLAHYPHHERVARIADEEGFLLWSEIPVYWDADFANADTLLDARNQLAELILRDRNRASVILWSVGNETPPTAARTRFLEDLALLARQLDGTRLVTAACTIQDGKIQDELAASLDVIGINEYFGWYDAHMEGLSGVLARSQPSRPVLISEMGAGALAGLRDLNSSLFSEERQAEVYRQQLEALANVPYLCGISPWILFDFRSERRQNSVQQGYNRKGLLAEDKVTKKLAYGMLSEFFRGWRPELRAGDLSRQ